MVSGERGGALYNSADGDSAGVQSVCPLVLLLEGGGATSGKLKGLQHHALCSWAAPALAATNSTFSMGCDSGKEAVQT